MNRKDVYNPVNGISSRLFNFGVWTKSHAKTSRLFRPKMNRSANHALNGRPTQTLIFIVEHDVLSGGDGALRA